MTNAFARPAAIRFSHYMQTQLGTWHLHEAFPMAGVLGQQSLISTGDAPPVLGGNVLGDAPSSNKQTASSDLTAGVAPATEAPAPAPLRRQDNAAELL